MSEPKKILELPVKTTLSANDVIIVQPASSNTSQMTVSNLRKNMVQGPFANDSAANTGGVLVGQMYYTVSGEVKVRIS